MSGIPELPPVPERFESLLWALLNTEPTISEYQLMKYLAEEGFTEFKPDLDPLILFRAHFLLFHLLYRLQDRWFFENRGWLNIHTTDIHLQQMTVAAKAESASEDTPRQESEQGSAQALFQEDSVKSYYLDYSEFLNTQEADVLNLLDDFWQKMAGGPIQTITQQDRLQAQQRLGLQGQTLTMQSVKSQFRSLCQLHHPDKGGNAQVFRQICDAKEVLVQSLKTL